MNEECDLKRFLKCFYVIKEYEGSDDYSLVGSDGFNIEDCLFFLKEVGYGNACSTKGSDFYCMGNVLHELIIRAERILEKKSHTENRVVDFIYEYNDLEKIVVRSTNLKDVINKIINEFRSSVIVEFKE